MQLVVGMNNGLGLIRCYSNDVAFVRVTNMITSLGWQSLEQRRQNSRLCMLYKIQHNLIDINRDLYIRHSDSRTRGKHRLFQERTNNETYRNSFFQQTVRDWNPLPASTVDAATIEEFRALAPPVAKPWIPCI